MRLGLNQRLGLSRNKVAVPEGVAGTPPFWSRHGDMTARSEVLGFLVCLFILLRKYIKEELIEVERE